eukprot:gnl/Carplike_NY0171/4155_a5615_451.p1 GENE.gnl/Carplike_NY0171/4155_a5615_451~~gnl/Carplike_NY0171/4155_a5615_451.p1  ORF type:complete len:211 (+),score=25.42 gnl/Carplike_NY0171/4155_a5615_451:1-633(+)
MVFVSSISIADHTSRCVNNLFAQRYPRSGPIKSAFPFCVSVHYKTSDPQSYMDLFKQGKVRCIVTVQMATEGFDLPGVDCVILGRKTESEIVFVQQIGRGLRREKRREEEEGDEDASKEGKKIMVRNIAFQATSKELRKLFTAYGQVKTVRMPKKYGGGGRGFCFVEFVSSKEAKRAYYSLKHTHFYGRHLVVEWAEEDSVEKGKRRFIE